MRTLSILLLAAALFCVATVLVSSAATAVEKSALAGVVLAMTAVAAAILSRREGDRSAPTTPVDERAREII